MKKAIYITLLVLMILIGVFIIIVVHNSLNPVEKYQLPKEGKWVSHDESIVLSFERSFDRKDYQSVIVIDGTPVYCYISRERYSSSVYLICDEIDNPIYSMGDTIFSGKITDISEDSFTIVSKETKEVYHFTEL